LESSTDKINIKAVVAKRKEKYVPFAADMMDNDQSYIINMSKVSQTPAEPVHPF
jgi:hypothetical protein